MHDRLERVLAWMLNGSPNPKYPEEPSPPPREIPPGPEPAREPKPFPDPDEGNPTPVIIPPSDPLQPPMTSMA
jgi:hypothetical protein